MNSSREAYRGGDGNVSHTEQNVIIRKRCYRSTEGNIPLLDFFRTDQDC